MTKPTNWKLLEKQAMREFREKELARRQRALPTKKYGVILADPPWSFKAYDDVTGMDRAADNHYPCSDVGIIAESPVMGIAADDSVLFLWATAPLLPDALFVMGAWGFAYKSHCVWMKDKFGTGYWFRNQHELLLVGTRGHPPAPAMGTQWPSVIVAERGRHSEKPLLVYDMIEAYFPTLPKIELYARMAREGWDAWGYEAPRGEDQ